MSEMSLTRLHRSHEKESSEETHLRRTRIRRLDDSAELLSRRCKPEENFRLFTRNTFSDSPHSTSRSLDMMR